MNFFRKLKPFLKIELFVASKFVEKLITLNKNLTSNDDLQT